MRIERPLVETLKKFTEKHPISFHVPGHKNGLISGLPQDMQGALPFDLTELTGLDDFHHPEGAIYEAEQLLAQTYGADRSFFLVNGSTVGNLAMIYAVCKRNEKVIVQRNAHKSIFHGLQLVGAKPIYVSPEWDEKTRTATHVTFTTLEEVLLIHQDAKAVILTSPTYYGAVSKELKLQIALCHELGIPVLVDEAHGAHFSASKRFPESALDAGADLVVQSAHKTLPAMTMASFLHIKSNLVDAERVNRYLRMLQSSSPSYVLLASLDDARHYVQTYLESDASYFFEKRERWIEALRSIPSLQVIEMDDPLKVLLRVPGHSGFQVKEALEERGIYPELADLHQVLLILPLLKQGQSFPFAETRILIKEAVAMLKNTKAMDGFATSYQNKNKISIPEYSFDELEDKETEWIPYVRAIGRVSAGMVIPYPPGIPLFIPGEKITVSKLSQLEELLAAGAAFQGEHRLEEKLLYVVKN
ncbi:aminotransferase class I/II-fold pyridoxal phosphate-dependent enzyme [Ureibacillus sp. FSL K6-8385]|uniref:Aminotransferase class I/II-fold pyridoxal phosphate-dependent enzyme n=1 Tax=Ureibacillus terrenus TaxID=118246 RepID=A0A540UYB9_9BACL|nr:aminotransferase class I/II-fold pyridoxal phosphate-dependent enzyme [Ureibacillus terrenus]MED3662462.1 aminotransferase class I/II-fold pyridoxal phosphate-dependent enzyme [Ureibacillus terrenus]MED3763230.1 aminotransferase class I/II-fold pyridoxal phosphate-dependent enzyme [Ureibacillus terrenus]TQE89499.1 aminotransferase class I/II-fold pyridoxal phosphate-dependent enzyme [Ureibacillus terrenus]